MASLSGTCTSSGCSSWINSGRSHSLNFPFMYHLQDLAVERWDCIDCRVRKKRRQPASHSCNGILLIRVYWNDDNDAGQRNQEDGGNNVNTKTMNKETIFNCIEALSG